MPLSPSTRAELRAELDRLVAERIDLDARIGALQSILGLPQRHPSGTVTIAEPLGSMTPDDAGEPQEGLRERIRAALALRPDGIKAGDVARIVEDAGYVSAGKTDVKTRVYNELYRLKRLKIVRRTPSGKFSLIPAVEMTQ